MRTHRESIPIDESNCVFRNSIANDIQRLLTYFINNTLINTFSAFKTFAWDKLDFSSIHLVSIHPDARVFLYDEIFAHYLKYIITHPSFRIRLAAFYALSLTFYTQPTPTHKNQFRRADIKLPLVYCQRVFAFIGRLREEARKDANVGDAVALFRRLWKDKAFLFVNFSENMEEAVMYLQYFDKDGMFPMTADTKDPRLAVEHVKSVETEVGLNWKEDDLDGFITQLELSAAAGGVGGGLDPFPNLPLFQPFEEVEGDYETLKSESGLFNSRYGDKKYDEEGMYEKINAAVRNMRENYRKHFTQLATQDIAPPVIDNTRRRAHVVSNFSTEVIDNVDNGDQILDIMTFEFNNSNQPLDEEIWRELDDFFQDTYSNEDSDMEEPETTEE